MEWPKHIQILLRPDGKFAIWNHSCKRMLSDNLTENAVFNHVYEYAIREYHFKMKDEIGRFPNIAPAKLAIEVNKQLVYSIREFYRIIDVVKKGRVPLSYKKNSITYKQAVKIGEQNNGKKCGKRDMDASP